MKRKDILLLILTVICFGFSEDRDFSKYRKLNYYPDGQSFVCINGQNKFTRALYGVYSGFRLETSDMPEFALYLPGMGGNLTFSIEYGSDSFLLNDAESIESRYTAGRRDYYITDPRLGEGKIRISALVMRQTDGALFEIKIENLEKNARLKWCYGGISGTLFFRNGDIGRDAPDSFELKSEYLEGNKIEIKDNVARLYSPKGDRVTSVFPPGSNLEVDEGPVLMGGLKINSDSELYYIGLFPKSSVNEDYRILPELFREAEADRSRLANTIVISTPDEYLNPLGGNLAVAAEGVWGGKSWLHGAIGWRESCLGWRAAYLGDVIGWHDRARIHFNTYKDMQIRDVEPVIPHPTQDSTMNLARSWRQWGTQMYSNGYICSHPDNPGEMSYYDMNLGYIDELLWHFLWTGDLDYVKTMWPTLTLHLEWEKRNFDPDDDGLYDAYCCIWSSDALYYAGGGVTHSTAYNYRANAMAARLAEMIGEDPEPYSREAEKILRALNRELWLSEKGHWAEYKDLLGYKRLHESAALWTIYHAIDSHTATPFQAYEATRYIDGEIPHIPILVEGLDEKLFEISTTNWSHYAWSINNVAMPETTHTALAYWQAGRKEEATKLLKAAILNYMYLGLSPGNFGLNSYYDRHTNQVYRDFADPLGTTSRAVVEGLYGVIPNLLEGEVLIKPGFPSSWDEASIITADFTYEFSRNGKIDHYKITPSFTKTPTFRFQLSVPYVDVEYVLINGEKVSYKFLNDPVGYPVMEIVTGAEKSYELTVKWRGDSLNTIPKEISTRKNNLVSIQFCYSPLNIYDPQNVLSQPKIKGNLIEGSVIGSNGERTFFVKHKIGSFTWWQPVHIQIEKEPTVYYEEFFNLDPSKCEMINIDHLLNDSVSKIFMNEYLSPRPPYTTLQITKYGAGEWCRPLEIPEIDDSGIRSLIRNNVLQNSLGVPFRSFAEGKNIAFTSLWDNFPNLLSFDLDGKGDHVYLLMAGSTNHMQSHIVNGTVTVVYKDGSRQNMELINPENWYTIDQDAFEDNYAFRRSSPKPYRLLLKNGVVTREPGEVLPLGGLYGHTIPCGAATLLDIPIDSEKELLRLEMETLSNDVIIGLMGITIQRR